MRTKNTMEGHGKEEEKKKWKIKQKLKNWRKILVP